MSIKFNKEWQNSGHPQVEIPPRTDQTLRNTDFFRNQLKNSVRPEIGTFIYFGGVFITSVTLVTEQ